MLVRPLCLLGLRVKTALVRNNFCTILIFGNKRKHYLIFDAFSSFINDSKSTFAHRHYSFENIA